MALIVEDGTVVEDANSYITLQFLKDYWNLRAITFKQDDTLLDANIIKATQYIDSEYQFKGCTTKQEQELSFPRLNLYDREGYSVTGIPKKLKKAVCESAKLFLDGVDLFASKQSNINSKSETVGPIKTAYTFTNGQATNEVYTSVKTYLKDYILPIRLGAIVRRY